MHSTHTYSPHSTSHRNPLCGGHHFSAISSSPHSTIQMPALNTHRHQTSQSLAFLPQPLGSRDTGHLATHGDALSPFTTPIKSQLVTLSNPLSSPLMHQNRPRSDQDIRQFNYPGRSLLQPTLALNHPLNSRAVHSSCHPIITPRLSESAFVQTGPGAPNFGKVVHPVNSFSVQGTAEELKSLQRASAGIPTNTQTKVANKPKAVKTFWENRISRFDTVEMYSNAHGAIPIVDIGHPISHFSSAELLRPFKLPQSNYKATMSRTQTMENEMESRQISKSLGTTTTATATTITTKSTVNFDPSTKKTYIATPTSKSTFNVSKQKSNDQEKEPNLATSVSGQSTGRANDARIIIVGYEVGTQADTLSASDESEADETEFSDEQIASQAQKNSNLSARVEQSLNSNSEFVIVHTMEEARSLLSNKQIVQLLAERQMQIAISPSFDESTSSPTSIASLSAAKQNDEHPPRITRSVSVGNDSVQIQSECSVMSSSSASDVYKKNEDIKDANKTIVIKNRFEIESAEDAELRSKQQIFLDARRIDAKPGRWQGAATSISSNDNHANAARFVNDIDGRIDQSKMIAKKLTAHVSENITMTTLNSRSEATTLSFNEQHSRTETDEDITTCKQQRGSPDEGQSVEFVDLDCKVGSQEANGTTESHGGFVIYSSDSAGDPRHRKEHSGGLNNKLSSTSQNQLRSTPITSINRLQAITPTIERSSSNETVNLRNQRVCEQDEMHQKQGVKSKGLCSEVCPGQGNKGVSSPSEDNLMSSELESDSDNPKNSPKTLANLAGIGIETTTVVDKKKRPKSATSMDVSGSQKETAKYTTSCEESHGRLDQEHSIGMNKEKCVHSKNSTGESTYTENAFTRTCSESEIDIDSQERNSNITTKVSAYRDDTVVVTTSNNLSRVATSVEMGPCEDEAAIWSNSHKKPQLDNRGAAQSDSIRRAFSNQQRNKTSTSQLENSTRPSSVARSDGEQTDILNDTTSSNGGATIIVSSTSPNQHTSITECVPIVNVVHDIGFSASLRKLTIEEEICTKFTTTKMEQNLLSSEATCTESHIIPPTTNSVTIHPNATDSDPYSVAENPVTSGCISHCSDLGIVDTLTRKAPRLDSVETKLTQSVGYLPDDAKSKPSLPYRKLNGNLPFETSGVVNGITNVASSNWSSSSQSHDAQLEQTDKVKVHTEAQSTTSQKADAHQIQTERLQHYVAMPYEHQDFTRSQRENTIRPPGESLSGRAFQSHVYSDDEGPKGPPNSPVFELISSRSKTPKAKKGRSVSAEEAVSSLVSHTEMKLENLIQRKNTLSSISDDSSDSNRSEASTSIEVEEITTTTRMKVSAARPSVVDRDRHVANKIVTVIEEVQDSLLVISNSITMEVSDGLQNSTSSVNPERDAKGFEADTPEISENERVNCLLHQSKVRENLKESDTVKVETFTMGLKQIRDEESVEATSQAAAAAGTKAQHAISRSDTSRLYAFECLSQPKNVKKVHTGRHFRPNSFFDAKPSPDGNASNLTKHEMQKKLGSEEPSNEEDEVQSDGICAEADLSETLSSINQDSTDFMLGKQIQLSCDRAESLRSSMNSEICDSMIDSQNSIGQGDTSSKKSCLDQPTNSIDLLEKIHTTKILQKAVNIRTSNSLPHEEKIKSIILEREFQSRELQSSKNRSPTNSCEFDHLISDSFVEPTVSASSDTRQNVSQGCSEADDRNGIAVGTTRTTVTISNNIKEPRMYYPAMSAAAAAAPVPKEPFIQAIEEEMVPKTEKQKGIDGFDGLEEASQISEVTHETDEPIVEVEEIERITKLRQLVESNNDTACKSFELSDNYSKTFRHIKLTSNLSRRKHVHNKRIMSSRSMSSFTSLAGLSSLEMPKDNSRKLTTGITSSIGDISTVPLMGVAAVTIVLAPSITTEVIRGGVTVNMPANLTTADPLSCNECSFSRQSERSLTVSDSEATCISITENIRPICSMSTMKDFVGTTTVEKTTSVEKDSSTALYDKIITITRKSKSKTVYERGQSFSSRASEVSFSVSEVSDQLDSQNLTTKSAATLIATPQTHVFIVPEIACGDATRNAQSVIDNENRKASNLEKNRPFESKKVNDISTPMKSSQSSCGEKESTVGHTMHHSTAVNLQRGLSVGLSETSKKSYKDKRTQQDASLHEKGSLSVIGSDDAFLEPDNFSIKQEATQKIVRAITTSTAQDEAFDSTDQLEVGLPTMVQDRSRPNELMHTRKDVIRDIREKKRTQTYETLLGEDISQEIATGLQGTADTCSQTETYLQVSKCRSLVSDCNGTVLVELSLSNKDSTYPESSRATKQGDKGCHSVPSLFDIRSDNLAAEQRPSQGDNGQEILGTRQTDILNAKNDQASECASEVFSDASSDLSLETSSFLEEKQLLSGMSGEIASADSDQVIEEVQIISKQILNNTLSDTSGSIRSRKQDRLLKCENKGISIQDVKPISTQTEKSPEEEDESVEDRQRPRSADSTTKNINGNMKRIDGLHARKQSNSSSFASIVNSNIGKASLHASFEIKKEQQQQEQQSALDKGQQDSKGDDQLTVFEEAIEESAACDSETSAATSSELEGDLLGPSILNHQVKNVETTLLVSDEESLLSGMELVDHNNENISATTPFFRQPPLRSNDFHKFFIRSQSESTSCILSQSQDYLRGKAAAAADSTEIKDDHQQSERSSCSAVSTSSSYLSRTVIETQRMAAKETTTNDYYLTITRENSQNLPKDDAATILSSDGQVEFSTEMADLLSSCCSSLSDNSGDDEGEATFQNTLERPTEGQKHFTSRRTSADMTVPSQGEVMKESGDNNNIQCPTSTLSPSTTTSHLVNTTTTTTTTIEPVMEPPLSSTEQIVETKTIQTIRRKHGKKENITQNQKKVDGLDLVARTIYAKLIDNSPCCPSCHELLSPAPNDVELQEKIVKILLKEKQMQNTPAILSPDGPCESVTQLTAIREQVFDLTKANEESSSPTVTSPCFPKILKTLSGVQTVSVISVDGLKGLNAGVQTDLSSPWWFDNDDFLKTMEEIAEMETTTTTTTTTESNDKEYEFECEIISGFSRSQTNNVDLRNEVDAAAFESGDVNYIGTHQLHYAHHGHDHHHHHHHFHPYSHQ